MHEQQQPAVRAVYPNGMHSTIAEGIREHLKDAASNIRTATFDQPQHGLSEAVLAETDVLTWAKPSRFASRTMHN